MTISNLQSLPFVEIIAYIDANYSWQPTGFKNGELINSAEENQGSAKVLFFSKLNNLTEEDTLKLFAEHYQNVLEDTEGTSHQNIRNFMKYGWEGVVFNGDVLLVK